MTFATLLPHVGCHNHLKCTNHGMLTLTSLNKYNWLVTFLGWISFSQQLIYTWIRELLIWNFIIMWLECWQKLFFFRSSHIHSLWSDQIYDFWKRTWFWNVINWQKYIIRLIRYKHNAELQRADPEYPPLHFHRSYDNK